MMRDNWVASPRRTTQFAVAATNHSALSSDEIRNARQSLARSPLGVAVSPPSEQ